jgi:hypothetical protein
MNNQKYTILTPTGFQEFDNIKINKKEEFLEIKLSDNSAIVCSLEHQFILDGIVIYAYELNIGTCIDSKDKTKLYVTDIIHKKEHIDLYDIINVKNGNIFYADNIVSHNCDTDFNTSGDTVYDPEHISWYEQTYATDPLEKRGMDNNLWIWEYPNYNHRYIVSADVARGDGKDYSAFHVINIDTCVQVATYKGQIGTTDFGNILVGVSSEYNDALLVVENSNMGWATIQTILERGYKNFYYSPKDNNGIDIDSYLYNAYSMNSDSMTPGFTNSTRTRPLVITSFDNYFKEKTIRINCRRTLEEMKVFIWHNGKAQAQIGYNDDLVVSLAIGLYIRNIASKYFDGGSNMNKSMLNSVTVVTPKGQNSIKDNYNSNTDPYIIKNNKGAEENIRWLL